VICSSSLWSPFSSGEFPPPGEIGIVERSTGEGGLPPCVSASRDVVAIAVVWNTGRELQGKKEVKRESCAELMYGAKQTVNVLTQRMKGGIAALHQAKPCG
jgi:hypothetical protein